MIRCKDIAEMVGVSRQAVTAVLNNSRPNCVSPEKRSEILKIAAQYNYHPNHAALALKTGKSNLIGIVMPPWHNPYIAELCMALQRALTAWNYTPFFTIDNNLNPVPGNLEQLLSLQVAGMITVASSLLPDNIDIPVVSYFIDDPRFDSVCIDSHTSSRQISEYLQKCGHRKIGYLGFADMRTKFYQRKQHAAVWSFTNAGKSALRIRQVKICLTDFLNSIPEKTCPLPLSYIMMHWL